MINPINKLIRELCDSVFNQNTSLNLELTPFTGKLHPADAKRIFCGISNAGDLLEAYTWAREHVLLEDSVPGANTFVDPFALNHTRQLIQQGIIETTDNEAKCIARWLQQLDAYSAIKSLESLLNSKADRTMLAVAEQQGWTLLFDHLAIRCGTESRADALRIVQFLREKHGYRPAFSEAQQHYRFDDGWDAYPLYKQLDNGLLLRLFVDESSSGFSKQIIQHWNHVYGYGAHHLAVRAIQQSNKTGQNWDAVPLTEFTNAMAKRQIRCMDPTGHYTQGLLEQVFTRPAHVTVPDYLTHELQTIDPDLAQRVQNGKLIELVSRKEMPVKFVKRLFLMLGIDYAANNPLHSCPVYPYFLPAQAAHVIRTSVQQIA